MSWKNVKLIFLREVYDQLRDRRMLFMFAVLPLLLYPAIGIGMVQMTVLFTEQPRTVVVLGSEDLPPPPLLQEGRFVTEWFDLPQEAHKLRVITDAGNPAAENLQILGFARQIRSELKNWTDLEQQAESVTDAQAKARLRSNLATTKQHLGRLFEESNIQVLIIVPPGFRDHVRDFNMEVAEHRGEKSADYPRPVILRNSADEKSLIAYSRVKRAFEAWEQAVLRERLQAAGLPDTLPTPVKPEPVDLAEADQIAANLWSKLFPALLVIMAMTGAFYPAVDLAAGEKERGTMETLLICPAKRSEIVIGKFLTVMLFSSITALLNLASMGFTGKYMASMAQGGALSRVGDLSFPTPLALFWMVVLLMPLAALFSALCLSLATFARSSKEGQYYLTPLLTVSIGLTVFCLSPAVEITPFYSVMPIIGPTLLLKSLLSNPGSMAPLVYALPVLVSSIGYSLLALWWAMDQFARESVLFREAERFQLRLWLKHLLRDKEPTPSFAEAGICFVLIMLLQFASIKAFQSSAPSPEAIQQSDAASGTFKILMIQQLALIAAPALLMGVMLTTSFRRTFRLRMPSLPMLGVALVLPLALHPLTLELSANMSWFFPPLPPEVGKLMAKMSSPDTPWWVVLGAMALTPAVCEELAYRGFILSGFSRSGRVGVAIALSSLTFGIMHMIPQQVFNAALLGVVLGLIAVRGNSLIPCVLFHFIYNGVEITRGRLSQSAWFKDFTGNWLITAGDGGIRYNWLTLVLCALVAGVILRWLVKHKSATPKATEEHRASNSRNPQREPSSPVGVG